MAGVRSNKVLVNVFDCKANRIIAEKISMQEAAELIGTTYKNINYAMKRKSKIKYRYLITYAGEVPYKMDTEPEPKQTFARDFTKRWNDALKPFQEYSKRKKTAI